MKIRLAVIGVLLVVILILAANLLINTTPKAQYASFAECMAAGNPISQTVPRQCTDTDGVTYTEAASVSTASSTPQIEPTMTERTALTTAQASPVCIADGTIGDFETYNPNSGTWWFTLNASHEGCNPACVVYDATGEVEVNWRCTGFGAQQ